MSEPNRRKLPPLLLAPSTQPPPPQPPSTQPPPPQPPSTKPPKQPKKAISVPNQTSVPKQRFVPPQKSIAQEVLDTASAIYKSNQDMYRRQSNQYIAVKYKINVTKDMINELVQLIDEQQLFMDAEQKLMSFTDFWIKYKTNTEKYILDEKIKAVIAKDNSADKAELTKLTTTLTQVESEITEFNKKIEQQTKDKDETIKGTNQIDIYIEDKTTKDYDALSVYYSKINEKKDDYNKKYSLDISFIAYYLYQAIFKMYLSIEYEKAPVNITYTTKLFKDYPEYRFYSEFGFLDKEFNDFVQAIIKKSETLESISKAADTYINTYNEGLDYTYLFDILFFVEFLTKSTKELTQEEFNKMKQTFISERNKYLTTGTSGDYFKFFDNNTLGSKFLNILIKDDAHVEYIKLYRNVVDNTIPEQIGCKLFTDIMDIVLKEDEKDSYKIKKLCTYFWHGNYCETSAYNFVPLIESIFVFLEIDKKLEIQTAGRAKKTKPKAKPKKSKKQLTR
jgi:hypothetical protein